MNARAATCFLLLFTAACALGVAVPSQAKQQPPTQRTPDRSPQGVQASNASQHAPMTPAKREEMRGDIFMARKMFRQAIQTYQDVLLSRGMPAKEQQRQRGFFQRLFGVLGHESEPQDPENSRLLDKIGIAYQQLGDIQQAETYYKRSAESDKHFASPLNNLGTVEFGRRKYKSAVKWYTKAIKVDPTIATTFSNMGYAYLAWNKYDDAILAFRQAILLDPGIFQNRGELGSVVETGGGANPGLYYYTLAKTFAMLGNADRCAHFLKMSRDEGYKKFKDALKDPAFRPVLKDPRVLAILSPPPTRGAGRTD
jgi:tetratricopeptide (TPR) repeat protein